MSKINRNRQVRRVRLHERVRNKVSGTAERPRLSVCFTGKHIYAQIIDDESRKTIVGVYSTQKEVKKAKPNIAGATEVGKLVAKCAKEKGISKVVFDRGGFQYHGKVKALADAARGEGLEF
jgi:large subunit ribosomal protein L18